MEMVVLPDVDGVSLQAEAQWVGTMITCWLDEEWTPLDVHTDLGSYTAMAYLKLRREGVSNLSELVIDLATELIPFNYRETFVNAFDVSNKVMELIMLRNGCEVCCTSDEDRSAIRRYEASLAATGQQPQEKE